MIEIVVLPWSLAVSLAARRGRACRRAGCSRARSARARRRRALRGRKRRSDGVGAAAAHRAVRQPARCASCASMRRRRAGARRRTSTSRSSGSTPQASDFQLAGLRNLYRPLASSTLGQRQPGQPADQPAERRPAASPTTRPPTTSASRRTCRGAAATSPLTFNNSRQATSNHVRQLQPDVHQRRSPPPSRSRCCATSASTTTASRSPSPRSTATSPQETLRATIAQTVANVRNAYWELAYARAARRRRAAVARAGRRSSSKTTRRASRSARWRRSTSCRPRPRRPPGGRRWRRPKPRWPPRSSRSSASSSTAPSDPLWAQELRADRPAELARAAARRRGRGPHARSSSAPTWRPPARTSTATTSRCASGATRRCRPSTCRSNYGAQGLGGTQFIRDGHRRRQHRSTGTHSRRLRRRAVGCSAAATTPPGTSPSTSATRSAAAAPTASTRARGCCAPSRRTRLRALELQVATEVTNAALQVQTNLRRVEAVAGGARAGRAAARGRAEQVRGRPVDQLLRRAGAARPGRRAERRAARAHRSAARAGRPSSAPRKRRPAAAARTAAAEQPAARQYRRAEHRRPGRRRLTRDGNSRARVVARPLVGQTDGICVTQCGRPRRGDDRRRGAG